MGLGSVIDFKPPIMESDFHFNAQKEDFPRRSDELKFSQIVTPSPSPPFQNGHLSSSTQINYLSKPPDSETAVYHELRSKHLAFDGDVKVNGELLSEADSVSTGVSQDANNSTVMPKETELSEYEKYIRNCSLTESGNIIKFDNFERPSMVRESSSNRDVEESVTSKPLSPLSISIAAINNTADMEVVDSGFCPERPQSGSPRAAVLTPSSSLCHFSANLASSQTHLTCADGADDGLILPSEQTLNRALELLKRPPSRLSALSSAQPSPISRKASTCTSSGKKEVAKRKTMQERLDRLRERNALVLNIPEFEQSNTTQLAILLRRFKKQYPVLEYLSEELNQHVLNNEHTDNFINSEPEPEISHFDRAERVMKRIQRSVDDPYATESESDYEDEEPVPSTSSAEANRRIHRNDPSYRCRAEFIELSMRDARADFLEKQYEKRVEIARNQLIELRRRKEAALMESNDKEDGSCARCLPFKSDVRRKIVRMAPRCPKISNVAANSLDSRERVLAYSLLDSRIDPNLSLLSGIPLERRLQTYNSRGSTRPKEFIRKRWDRSPWLSRLEESKEFKKSNIEERRKRKREESENGKDIITDRQKGSSNVRRSRPNNYHSTSSASSLKRARNSLFRRSLNQKRNGDRRGNRIGSIFEDKDQRNPSELSQNMDLDETSQDFSLVGLPQKIDYKDIFIPNWRLVEREPSSATAELPCASIAEETTLAEISRRHLSLEQNERKRFQQYRDFVASKASASASSSKLSGNSGATNSKLAGRGQMLSRSCSADSASSNWSYSNEVSPVHFQFDDEQSNSNVDQSIIPNYDRPSVVKPYSPRIFPVPTSVTHCSL